MGHSNSKAKIGDHFEVYEELGRGAFSTVKRAKDLSTGEIVALKIVPSAVFDKNRTSMEREVSILQQVGAHPNIVTLHRVVATKNQFLIATELLTGGELFSRICEREKYNEEDARIVTRQLLEGIAHLHSKSIAHRDLKPENAIFVDKSTNAPIKITDFGFAGVCDPNSRFIQCCGTPLYVAPEIINGIPYDEQCDMWSLGVIVYILLCGFPPFYANDDTELFNRIRHAKYEFSKPHWDFISLDAKDFISKLFQVDPRKRLSATEALCHRWVKGTESIDLPTTVEELRRTQYKMKLIKGVHAVIAMNRLSRGKCFESP